MILIIKDMISAFNRLFLLGNEAKVRIYMQQQHNLYYTTWRNILVKNSYFEQYHKHAKTTLAS